MKTRLGLIGLLVALTSVYVACERATELQGAGDRIDTPAASVADRQDFPTRLALNTSSRGKKMPFVPVEGDMSSVLFIDSILSIVQSYYVDTDRVANGEILKTAIGALQAEGYLKAKFQDQRVKVRSNDHEAVFSVSPRLRYESMLEAMITLAQTVDRKIEEDKAESSTEEQDGLESSLEALPAQEGTEIRPDVLAVSKGSEVVLGALLRSLDAHSGLLGRDAYRELRQGTEGTFGGLGVLVGIRGSVLTVIRPLPGSPAFRNGFKKDDQILTINGMDTFGYSLDHLVEYMRGDPGSDVNVTLLKPGANSPRKLVLTREIILVDSVTAHSHPMGDMVVPRLKVENFSSRTSREILNAISRFKRKNNGYLPGLILDLRSNPGGLLDQAVQVSDIFLPEGVIVETRGRRQEVEHAGAGFDEVDFPIVILINGDSASASEIVAGALQDHKRAVVIGQPSFGKGSVQTVFELPGEKALKLTIARYYTPLGGSIQNVGITPDIWIQPIYKSEKNENLLGEFRYRTERFLSNHLEAGSIRSSGQAVPSKVAYYLADHQPGIDELPLEEDRDIELAMSIIKKNVQVHGVPLPKGVGRSTHWLALASDEVSERVNGWNSEVQSFLAGNFDVDWGSGVARVPTATLSTPGMVNGPLYPGDVASVPFSIRNESADDLGKVSVYFRSDVPGLAPVEVLVGLVAGREVYSGSIPLSIPTYLSPGEYSFDLGITSESKLIDDQTRKVTFRVRKRSNPKLLPIVELLSEEGGKIPGVLEPNETATITITVKNDGAVPTKNLAVKVLNLSGTQVEVESEIKDLGNINPGKSNKIAFRITGTADIQSDNLGFGLSIEGQTLEYPYREKFEVEAAPSKESKVSKFFAH